MCPTPSVCYSLNVPDTTASSGSGDIYFQISAPTSYAWVALGQGTQMVGSNIFVMYASSTGDNVTLSPRLTSAYVMPQYDSSAEVTLLYGTGINNGMMTANVKCSNCQKWNGGSADFSGTGNSDWVYAYKVGSAINSDDPNAVISQHDNAEPFTFSLASAQGGSDTNPFNGSAVTAPDHPTGPPGAPSFGGNLASAQTTLVAVHGGLASVAFIFLFPIGGILIRLAKFHGLIWVHAVLQMVAYALYFVAFGMGMFLSHTLGLEDHAHPIIGIVIFLALLSQPFTGYVHHRLFKKYNRRTAVSYFHLGIGRIAILLGMINGFLGVALAANMPKGAQIGHAVVTVIMLIVYAVSVVIGEIRRKRELSQGYDRTRNLQARRLSQSEEDAVVLQETPNK